MLGARLLRRARRLGDAVEQAGPLYAPERLHDVRILTKKLRYALEIADDFGVEGTKPLVKALKKQQDQLGHLHDLEMLLTRVREAEASPVAGAHLDDLAIYADSLERECRRLHATYVERRRALIDCVNEVRLVVVPSLATEARRQARILPMPDHEERRSRIRSNNVDAPAREK